MGEGQSILLLIGAIFFGIIAVIVVIANLAKRFGRPATTAGSSWDSENDSSFWNSSLSDNNVPGDRDGDGDVDAADSGWSDDSSGSDDSSSDSDDSGSSDD